MTRDVQQDDRQLIDRIARGDESALGDFYRAFEGPLYRFAYARLNDSFEAADIVNDVMMEVWRNATRFEGRSKVSTWVFGIARHKSIDRLRKRRPDHGEELDDNLPDDEGDDPETCVLAAENAELVRLCIEGLSEAHREVVHLAFFEDLPYAEIAGIAGCPEGTVKTRMFHAKKALQRCLQHLMGDGP